MNQLVAELRKWTGQLRPAPAVTNERLFALRVAIAASLLRQDPSLAEVDVGDAEPWLPPVIAAGAVAAAELAQADEVLRVVRDDLPLGSPFETNAERPLDTFGPFVDDNGLLVRFVSFASGRFTSVHFASAGFPQGADARIYLPAELAPDEALQVWTLAPGTVWVARASFQPAGSGFVGLRVAGGRLRLDQVPAVLDHRLVLAPGTTWSLEVEPEAPPPAAPAGSDVRRATLTLPARIRFSAEGAIASGAVTLAGFGTTLSGALAPAPANVEGAHLAFPVELDQGAWSIASHHGRAAALKGTCEVERAGYLLPLVDFGPRPPGEAWHGGVLRVDLGEGVTVTMAGQRGGPTHFRTSTLLAHAHELSLDGLAPRSFARYEARLWQTATTRLTFADAPLQRLFWKSERDGVEAIALFGGRLTNRWDRPRSADGRPFEFEGPLELWAILADATGFRLLAVASSAVERQPAALALANAFLRVLPPRQLALSTHAVSAPGGRAGTAVLFFDAIWALPTLPDPYAWNLRHTDFGNLVERALRIDLDWTRAQSPALAVTLAQPLALPAGPPDAPRDPDEEAVRGRFRGYLDAQRDVFRLLDLSSHVDLLGVALEPAAEVATIRDNQLNVPLSRVRLLLQPQVLWEVVKTTSQPNSGLLKSEHNGGPALAGVHSVKLVPVRPEVVCGEIPAARGNQRAAALFSLPFGLRGLVRLHPHFDEPQAQTRRVATSVHEPRFGAYQAARQLRLVTDGAPEPSRRMPGQLVQLANLKGGGSVLGGIAAQLNSDFAESVPLHHADLSGYGLSTASSWSQNLHDKLGITKAFFTVLNGRTSYELIQRQVICWPCQSIWLQTVILERLNTGAVVRLERWDALTDGTYDRWINFDKGVVQGLHHIRRIRVIEPEIPLGPIRVQRALFDADAAFEDLRAGGRNGRVPVVDQVGYIQLAPDAPFAAADLAKVFAQVGPLGGPADCRVRANGTLEMQISGLLADHAPGAGIGFAVAAYGSPKLPRAGQWSVVRIAANHDTVPVDKDRGVPITRASGQPYRFREPSEARLAVAKTPYAFLMATDSSRVLFKEPRLELGQPGNVFTAPPLIADPYALCQASSVFPRPEFALTTSAQAVFAVGGDDQWRWASGDLAFTGPAAELIKGGEWSFTRSFPGSEKLALRIDSADAVAWDIAVPPTTLEVVLPVFGPIMTIRTRYLAQAGGPPKLAEPKVSFVGPLEEVKRILDSLEEFVDLPTFVKVTVSAAGTTSPTFIVRIQLRLRIAEGPNERVDIGLGKFYGEFLLDGELEAAPTGVKRGVLSAQFTGDLQQGILPPLLYAGGLFRFAVQITDAGRPRVELTFAAVASIGGDLIKGLLEVEVTVKYGYTLIPETLEPGVFLGLEVRAKLLGGLFGFSFGAEVMARVSRLDPKSVEIKARVRVVATVQVAYFFEDDVDFETEFEQKIPLAAVAALAGANPLAIAALL